MWTVMNVIAFNGQRGIAEDRVNGTTYQFTADQVKPNDIGRIKAGGTILITRDGYIEESTASFVRMYGHSDEQSVDSGVPPLW